MKRIQFAVSFSLAGLVWVVILLVAPRAGALYGDIYGPFGFNGSIRIIAALADNSNLPSFYAPANTEETAQAVLRLIAQGRPSSGIGYELHAVQNLDYKSGEDAWAAGAAARYQSLDLAWDQDDRGEVQAALAVDRVNVTFSLPWADFTVGRQAVTFGKAYFWNPLDVFFPFDPQQLDRDYKPGVDAFRLDVPIGLFSGVNFLYVLGREKDVSGQYVDGSSFYDASWTGSSLLVRAFTTAADWDLSLMAGKVYGGWLAGGGASGEIGPLEVRFEAAQFLARQDDRLPCPMHGKLYEDHLMAVAGIGHRFENTLTLELEYLYNGAGDPDNLEASFLRVLHGITPHAGRHLTGFMVSYEFLPILLGQMVWLHSISDDSGVVQPSLQLSLSEEVDLLVAATFSRGDRPSLRYGLIPVYESEFGSYPDVYLIEIKFYF